MTGGDHDGHEPGERFVPRWALMLWDIRDLIAWPLTARQLRQAGFRRTGWRTWEAGPGGGDDRR